MRTAALHHATATAWPVVSTRTAALIAASPGTTWRTWARRDCLTRTNPALINWLTRSGSARPGRIRSRRTWRWCARHSFGRELLLLLAKPIQNILPWRHDWPQCRLSSERRPHGCARLRRSPGMLWSGMLRLRDRPVPVSLRRRSSDRRPGKLLAHMRSRRSRHGAGNWRARNGGCARRSLIAALARSAKDLAWSGSGLQWSCRNWSGASRGCRSRLLHCGNSWRWGCRSWRKWGCRSRSKWSRRSRGRSCGG